VSRELQRGTTAQAVDWADFDQQIAAGTPLLPLFRERLRASDEELARRFYAGEAVERLVAARVAVMDQLLLCAWRHHLPAADDIALVAVGGYGRGELHPASDIDLLILFEADDTINPHAAAIEAFLLLLWDLKLEVGHSARSIDECVRQAEADITVATNLMEARLLIGPETLFQRMQEATGPARIWTSADFFSAKLAEQEARHHRFHDTGYNLEPNIKESPGGLRDLQVIGWVAKRHFDARSLHDLVAHGFLTEREYTALHAAQIFLWRVRFGLHLLTGRHEDRLLFDHQRTLAEEFGYRDRDRDYCLPSAVANDRPSGRGDAPCGLAVEQFMKDYYRTVMKLSRLNEMLLQLFREEILLANESITPVPLHAHFQARRSYLETVDETLFSRRPKALLELFLVMASHPELRGVRADTIRQVHEHLHLIDAEFRADPEARALFIDLFRQGRGLAHELRRMNRYGLLAAYLPVFANIVGQMQHDLFHIYTVDEHTMFVVRNLRRFTIPQYRHELPLCSEIVQRLRKPELLYLAGFFHDIAKGRGGDHSHLGAADAADFCHEHGLSELDTQLVSWLVENHLIMSSTAQRKDISDPEVISAFAQQVNTQERLNHLYLLTVADIRATNDSLWNSWKGALLAELYHATSRQLRRGLENPLNARELVGETQDEALRLLTSHGSAESHVRDFWQTLPDEYFLRHSAEEIAWQTLGITERPANDSNCLVRAWGESHRGGTEIFVYCLAHQAVFAIITATLEQLGLNVTDARVVTTEDNHALDTFLVLDHEGLPVKEQRQLEAIEQRLRQQLESGAIPSPPLGRLNRLQRHFPIATEVLFREDEHHQRSVLEVITGDRLGLLAGIARALLTCRVRLQTAKIATLGERAEDIFLVTNQDSRPLAEENRECLRAQILRQLDEESREP